MPNKNSIESEITKLLNVYLEGLHNPKDDQLYNELRAMRDTEALKKGVTKIIQREVKKGRVEELEKLNQNLIKSGVEEKAEERIMLVIDDRLEELEG